MIILVLYQVFVVYTLKVFSCSSISTSLQLCLPSAHPLLNFRPPEVRLPVYDH